METNYVLGIDIGSVSISLVLLSPSGEVEKHSYRSHSGEITETFLSMISEYDLGKIKGYAVTASSPDIFNEAHKYDHVVCIIAAVQKSYRNVRTVINVGGEKFGAVLFDENSNYLNYSTNTSCAAGTGSFLDQQARRLNLSGIEEFSDVAYNNSGNVPRIASRCAVFAKTDLIHAQQEGFTLAEICDGLSRGLAVNICDTLFINNYCEKPALLIGGVSMNKAVVKHLSDILSTDITIDKYSHVYCALGAAVNLQKEGKYLSRSVSNPKNLLKLTENEKKYHYEPLELKLSNYPDFESHEKYHFESRHIPNTTPVEVDIYSPLIQSTTYNVYLGIDIGSTSTKAVLSDPSGEALAGFYTRTSGRPMEAVQSIFEAIDQLRNNLGIDFKVMSAATTGSGRKFIGQAIGADLIIDEITAHAKAAHSLDKDVDTIIEIGGQDAKFTTLKNGMVTFSIMNNVCAAGTGSFIEELAKKMNTPLSEYSERAEKVMSPVTSDRCTVFMERDLNYYIREGYSVNEVLSSVLHSVRENYLTKVAVESNIGNKIFFQGATAKNRALVAAFEQRLKKPIMVSKFCHLTGALGAAQYAASEKKHDSSFKGFSIYRDKIPVKTETCGICTNHCKIKVINLKGEDIAFGFLCGRDYNTKKFVKKTSAFDLLSYRKKMFSFQKNENFISDTIIGIPFGLHMADEMPIWKIFFNRLGIKTITSEDYASALKDGKHISEAEFCAPMQSLYGHVHYLMDRSDYVFLPVFFSEKQKNKNLKRQYCYYTQFSSVVVAPYDEKQRKKLISPVIRYVYGGIKIKLKLYQSLREVFGDKISIMDVSTAYDEAVETYERSLSEMKEFFLAETENSSEISVVFLGRPYTVLSNSMNNGIPEIFNKFNVKNYFMDMLTYGEEDVKDLSILLNEVHWKYAAKIIECAEVVAAKKGIYPVLITSFKCTPDAFVIDYFKKIMDSHKKPYLILQLDEHDSSVGYETRIEAGIRSFNNHFVSSIKDKPRESGPHVFIPTMSKKSDVAGKTILIPNWDLITSKFLEANLKSEGYDVRVLEESHDIIRRSLKYNTGQCIPMNSLAEQIVDYMNKYEIDPEKCAFWMFRSDLSCNVRMYPFYIKGLMDEIGGGMEKIDFYTGQLTFSDFSLKASVNAYFAYMFGGILRKLGCRIRPYEKLKGETDGAIRKSVNYLYDVFLNKRDKEEAITKVLDRFKWIETEPAKKPKVAIFGDLYVRDNDIMNQNLIKVIEDNGGEALTTPYNEYIKIIAEPYFKRWFVEGYYSDYATVSILYQAIKLMESKYNKLFSEVLNEPQHEETESFEEILSKLNMKPHHTGESMDNILKIYHLMRLHPDISLFVQTNPAFCCPSIVTEAMSDKIERFTGVPVVSITYDGTGGSKNDVIIPYIKFPRKA